MEQYKPEIPMKDDIFPQLDCYRHCVRGGYYAGTDIEVTFGEDTQVDKLILS